MTFSTSQKLGAEALGTALLLAIVVGSGIMGESLAAGNTAIALLGNTIATGAGLVILIIIFGPVSGAHFNPAVTLAFALRQEISPGMATLYGATQIAAGLIGVIIAHAMFDLETLQMSTKGRSGSGQALGEAIATLGLVLTILGALRFRPESVPYAVGLFITAGYWFTSSTSFANPAVTIARSFTDTFAGIRPSDAPMFILAQFSAAAIATGIAAWLFVEKKAVYTRSDEGPAEPLSSADQRASADT